MVDFCLAAVLCMLTGAAGEARTGFETVEQARKIAVADGTYYLGPGTEFSSGAPDQPVGIGGEPAAIEYWLAATTIDPNHAKSHVCLGFAFTKAESWQQAEHHYRSAVAAEPQSAANRHLLALVLNAREKCEEAHLTRI